MTQEEILEGNKLIVQFMGCKNLGKLSHLKEDFYEVLDHPFDRYFNSSQSWEKETKYILSSLRYDCDWNWLMPALHKFDTLDLNKLTAKQVDEYCALCDLHDDAMALYEIDKIYPLLLKSLKWYENNQIIQ